MIPTILSRFTVSGTKFNKFQETMPEVCEKVELIHEPDNIYDPQAVAVYVRGNKCGFVPRIVNSMIQFLPPFQAYVRGINYYDGMPVGFTIVLIEDNV